MTEREFQATVIETDDMCERCGVNPAYGGGLCRFCSQDDDFESCEFCHGEGCTFECEDERG